MLMQKNVSLKELNLLKKNEWVGRW
jgi:hypothetical protein